MRIHSSSTQNTAKVTRDKYSANTYIFGFAQDSLYGDTSFTNNIYTKSAIFPSREIS